jgi:branched-chain amino acid transport system permease protein
MAEQPVSHRNSLLWSRPSRANCNKHPQLGHGIGDLLTELLGLSLTTWLQLVLTGGALGCIYGLVALGFNITFNATGIINFAQGNFVIIGGLLFFTLHGAGLPTIIAAICAVVGTAILGALSHLLITGQTRGKGSIGAGIATLGIALLAEAICVQIWGPETVAVPVLIQGSSLKFLGVALTLQQVLIVCATIAVAVGLWLYFRLSVTGISMRATSLNGEAARGVGVRITRTSVIAFGMAALLAGIGGVLITPLTGADPSAGAFILTLKGFAAAALGGLGNFQGAILGGLALGMIESISGAYVGSSWQVAIPMVVLLIVFFVRPGGIKGALVGHRA